MKSNRFILQPYKGPRSRYTCPSCHKPQTLSLYINTSSGDPIASNVGRCNREVKCGYHYTPRNYFEDNPGRILTQDTKIDFKVPGRPIKAINQISYIPAGVVEKTLNASANNNFLYYLKSLFGEKVTSELAKKYLIGTSKYWPNSTVFWQKDTNNRFRTGKIILYDPDKGKRIKEPYSHIAWAHSALKIKDFKLAQCLFGEHLLTTQDNPVAIVESEKTAIIASVYLPRFIWLATGGVSNLNSKMLKPLASRKIFLFPDLNCYLKWKQKAHETEKEISCKVYVSDFLETNANDKNKEKGLDIADFLIRRDKDFGWALSSEGYPIFWDLNL